MNPLHIFLIGVIVLVGAILLNSVASLFGLMSWYDFLRAPRSATALSYVWLFVLYPFGLGVLAYYGTMLVTR